MDIATNKKITKSLHTFRSGTYVLSGVHNAGAALETLDKCLSTARVIEELPVFPHEYDSLKYDFLLSSIHDSLAIDSTHLNKEAITELLSSVTMKEQLSHLERDVVFLKTANHFIMELNCESDQLELSEELLKKLSRLTTHGSALISDKSEYYRDARILSGATEYGDHYKLPKILSDIKVLMRGYVRWFNSEPIASLPVEVRASLAHYHILLIHPFESANGRTARLIEAMILHATGKKLIPQILSTYYYTHRDDYFRIINECRKSNGKSLDLFIDFSLKGHLYSLERVKKRLSESIVRIMLRDYYTQLRNRKHLTAKQYELLNILVENPQPFTIADLFRMPHLRPLYASASERTGRRDVKKLTEMGLLAESKSRLFEVNLTLSVKHALRRPERQLELIEPSLS